MQVSSSTNSSISHPEVLSEQNLSICWRFPNTESMMPCSVQYTQGIPETTVQTLPELRQWIPQIQEALNPALNILQL